MPVPSIVLVHGAWHGPWCWDLVAAHLADRGVTPVVVDLPFTGFADDAAAVRDEVSALPGDVVVCGHSYGGLVVDRAVAGLEGVSRVVYLAAIVGTGLDVLADDPPALTEAIVPVPDGTCTVAAARARDIFYGDSDEAVAWAAVARLRPMVLDVEAFLSDPPPRPEAGTTYVVCTGDRALPPAAQRRLAAGCDRALEWPTDHSPFLTRPDAVAELLVVG